MMYRELRSIAYCFLLGNLTLAIFSVMLTFGPCNAGKFESDSSYGLEFISTKLLRCKYSDYVSCYILPPVILINVALVLVQCHHTACIMGHQSSYCDASCYISVLGFSLVVLFDSQRVSEKARLDIYHVTGVGFLTVAALVLHWLCLDNLHKFNTYAYIEYVYACCLVLFISLFAMNVPAAIQIEYIILCVFFLLNSINLTLQFGVLDKHQVNFTMTDEKYITAYKNGKIAIAVCVLVTATFSGVYVSNM
jgi:hypothetical protein